MSVTESQQMIFATIARPDVVDFDNPNSHFSASHLGVMEQMISAIQQQHQSQQQQPSHATQAAMDGPPNLDIPPSMDGGGPLPTMREGSPASSFRSASPPVSRGSRGSRSSARNASRSRRSGQSRHSRHSSGRRRRRAQHRSQACSTVSRTGGQDQVRSYYIDKMREIHGPGGFDEERYKRMNLRDLQFMYTRNKTDADTRSTVNFMKDIIKFGMSGVEGLNEWMGPYLRLKGWARDATQDMSRYDAALEKIYKRYWRHGSVNPFLELGMLIVGSAVIYHWQNKQSAIRGDDDDGGGGAFHGVPSSPGHPQRRRTMKPPAFSAPAGGLGGGPAGGEGGMGGLGGLMGGLMGGGGGGQMLGNLMPLLKMMT